MKVKELITKLQSFDPEMTVTVDGYEGGVSEKFDLKVTNVIPNKNDEWYYGEHEPDDDEGTMLVLNIG